MLGFARIIALAHISKPKLFKRQVDFVVADANPVSCFRLFFNSFDSFNLFLGFLGFIVFDNVLGFRLFGFSFNLNLIGLGNNFLRFSRVLDGGVFGKK